MECMRRFTVLKFMCTPRRSSAAATFRQPYSPPLPAKASSISAYSGRPDSLRRSDPARW